MYARASLLLVTLIPAIAGAQVAGPSLPRSAGDLTALRPAPGEATLMFPVAPAAPLAGTMTPTGPALRLGPDGPHIGAWLRWVDVSGSTSGVPSIFFGANAVVIMQSYNGEAVPNGDYALGLTFSNPVTTFQVKLYRDGHRDVLYDTCTVQKEQPTQTCRLGFHVTDGRVNLFAAWDRAPNVNSSGATLTAMSITAQ